MNILDIYPDIENAPVEIRMSRAKASDTPSEILECLSHDSFWFVRDLVASNPNTPISCLKNLMQDTDFRIRYDAKKTLETLHFKSNESKPSLRSQIDSVELKSEEGKDTFCAFDHNLQR